ncbi:MAG: periplasmic heavy metal sensor [Thermodesulfobacteriota bacterium]
MRKSSLIMIAVFLTLGFIYPALAADPAKPVQPAKPEEHSQHTAQEAAPATKTVTPDKPAEGAHSSHGAASGRPTRHGMAMMKMMDHWGVPDDKKETIMKISREYDEKLFALRQDLHAKQAELEAVMSQAQPDLPKAKAVIQEIAGLGAGIMEQIVEMRARIIKETGVRLPVTRGMMGHMMGRTRMGD